MPSNTSPSGREKRPSARAVMEVGGWWDGSYLKRYVSIFPGPGGGNLDTLPPPILSASFLFSFFFSSSLCILRTVMTRYSSRAGLLLLDSIHLYNIVIGGEGAPSGPGGHFAHSPTMTVSLCVHTRLCEFV